MYTNEIDQNSDVCVTCAPCVGTEIDEILNEMLHCMHPTGITRNTIFAVTREARVRGF